jgi:hypothetical protein
METVITRHGSESWWQDFLGSKSSACSSACRPSLRVLWYLIQERNPEVEVGQNAMKSLPMPEHFLTMIVPFPFTTMNK